MLLMQDGRFIMALKCSSAIRKRFVLNQILFLSHQSSMEKKKLETGCV